MNRTKSIGISITLHALIFVLFASGGGAGNSDSKDSGGSGGSDHVGDIIPKQEAVEVDFIPAPEDGGDTPKPEKQVAVKECADNAWYGGIGVVVDYNTRKVEDAPKGYPAYKEGIRTGDVIVWQSDADLRGEVGTIVTVKVHRPSTDVLYTIDITRDKICYKD